MNDKSDEEDPEQRSRRNNPPSELLTQLLKEGGVGGGGGGPEFMQGVGGVGASGGEDLLQLLSLGGQKSALKRKLTQEEQSIKRPHSTDPQQVNIFTLLLCLN